MAGSSTGLSSALIAEKIQDVSVYEVMMRWPDSPPVFLKHGMMCVGCAVARFHSLGEACEFQEVSLSEFCDDLLSTLGSEAFENL